MSVQEISFKSQNGRDEVKGWSYTPLGKPHGIIQLIHGFGEHSRRYLHMIGKFVDAGFIVYADDHIGHGKTAVDSHTEGDPHSKDYMTYLQDEKTLHDMAVEKYPEVPFFLFGHSWGSMMARAYAALYGKDVKAMVLCGVVSQMKGCEQALSNAEFKADYEKDPYQNAGKWKDLLFLGTTERFPQPQDPNDWLATDKRVLKDYANDPFVITDVTLQLIWDFVELYKFIENKEWAEKVPVHIPAYLIAGDNDPCGNYGEGLYHVANLLAQTGHEVSVKAYSGYRHEIHNEVTVRDEVEQDIVDFYNTVVNKLHYSLD